MPILIPSFPEPERFNPSLSTSAIVQRSTVSGMMQRYVRAGGDRYTCQFQLRGLSYEQGAPLQAMLEAGLYELVSVPIPQHGMEITSGNGSGSGSGDSLTVSSSGVKPGQWLSFEADGRSFLHKVRAASGGTLTVVPHLRFAVSGVSVEFVEPRIVGYISDLSHGMEVGFSRGLALNFSITEGF